MEIIAEYGYWLVLVTCVVAFLMAWGIGANDVANAMGTSVGSKALTIKQAIIIAIIFEFLGAYLAGGEVTSTIRKGIIDPVLLQGHPEKLVFGMMAALFAAGVWLFIASFKGWPVSTTHSIVGAIVGFAVVALGVDAVQWGKVLGIVMSWVVSPLMSGTIAFLLFKSVQRLILDTDDPFHRAKKFIPFYMFMVGFLIASVTLLKGLKHLGLELSYSQSLLCSLVIGVVVALIGKMILNKVKVDTVADAKFRYASVEKVFAVLMIFTACAMAFAHGSNDVANAVGPMAAVINVVQSGGDIMQKSSTPSWVLLLGGLGIVAGLALMGYRVIGTIGTKITHLTPSRGFAAELAAAATVTIASGTGWPVSTTHTLVGAILGVGMARGVAALNFRVVGNIVTSWLVTLPIGAVLCILFYFFFSGLFAL